MGACEVGVTATDAPPQMLVNVGSSGLVGGAPRLIYERAQVTISVRRVAGARVGSYQALLAQRGVRPAEARQRG